MWTGDIAITPAWNPPYPPFLSKIVDEEILNAGRLSGLHPGIMLWRRYEVELHRDGQKCYPYCYPSNKKGLSTNDNPLINMARPERLLGATPLAPSGPPSLRDDVLRRLRRLVELPTAWFVAFQSKHPILLF